MATTSAEPRAIRVMPFGMDKGKPLSDVSDRNLRSTLDWIERTDPEKFANLTASIQQELDSRPIRKPATSAPSKQLMSQIIHQGMLEVLSQIQSEEETKQVQTACQYMRQQLYLPL